MPSNDDISTIYGDEDTKRDKHELATNYLIVLKHPKTFFPQSSIVLTPKWSTQSGS